jgi:hypothetical protein
MFFGVFTIFLLFGIATFTSFEIKRGFDMTAQSGARVAEIGGDRRAFQRGLGITASVVTVAVLVAGGVLFFVMPRFSAGYFSNLAQAQTLSGFSNNVSLGEIGTIKQSTQVVMHVKINEASGNLPVLRWRGRGMTRFDGKTWSNSQEAFLLDSRFTNGSSAAGDHALHRHRGADEQQPHLRGSRRARRLRANAARVAGHHRFLDDHR